MCTNLSSQYARVVELRGWFPEDAYTFPNACEHNWCSLREQVRTGNLDNEYSKKRRTRV